MLTSAAWSGRSPSTSCKRGEGCPMCAQGRPEETEYGVRFFAGEVSDAYLQRATSSAATSIVVWRGRHVAEPTELDRRGGGAVLARAARGRPAARALLRAGQAELRPARQLAAAPAHARDAALRRRPEAGLAVPVPGGRPRRAGRGPVPPRPRGASRLSGAAAALASLVTSAEPPQAQPARRLHAHSRGRRRRGDVGTNRRERHRHQA